MALYRSMGARPEDDGSLGTTTLDVRKMLATIVSSPGVLPGGVTPLVTGTAAWAYSVGRAAWATSRGSSDGYHLWGNDGSLTVGATGAGSTVPPAPGAGLSRIDIIYALHPSASENSDTTSEPIVAVASGVAASLPTAPTLPVGALELARNTMTSAATTTASAGNSITQTAPAATLVMPPAGSTVVSGTVGPTTNTSPLAVMTAPTVLGDGLKRFKITASIRTCSGTSATDFFTFSLVEVISGSTIAQWGTPFVSTAAGIYTPPLTMVASHVPPAGARSYRLDVARTNPTGGALTAIGRMEILVEQIA